LFTLAAYAWERESWRDPAEKNGHCQGLMPIRRALDVDRALQVAQNGNSDTRIRLPSWTPLERREVPLATQIESAAALSRIGAPLADTTLRDWRATYSARHYFQNELYDLLGRPRELPKQ
jgi:hypothetical protein